ncbi:MAG: ribonuclease III [Bacteroidetes bacterium]|nr:ribonuclease III [Bacteroidota bacterium]
MSNDHPPAGVMVRFTQRLYNLFLHKDRSFARVVYGITGYMPYDVEVYKLSFRHSSMVKDPRQSAMQCNERLEYLGDSVLGTIVADFLYHKYPMRQEGFLTETRSKIVSRQSLNDIAEKLGFEGLLEYNRKGTTLNRSMYGNTLEAFIGALYVDRGYRATRRFILRRIVRAHLSLDDIIERNENYKSQLMEYAQRNRLTPVLFQVIGEKGNGRQREFTVRCIIDGKELGTGVHIKKKLAEQEAARESLLLLNVNIWQAQSPS